MPNRRPARRFALCVLPCLAVCVAAFSPPPAAAQQVRLGNAGPDSPARVVPRLGADDAAFRIETRDGQITLALTDDAVALQFTDRGLQEAAKPQPISAGDDSALARLLHRLVHEGVRALLDNAIEYPLWDLAEARYEEDRLRLLRHDGQEVFGDVRIDGEPVMNRFEPADAREFARRFQRAQGREL